MKIDELFLNQREHIRKDSDKEKLWIVGMGLFTTTGIITMIFLFR